MIVRSIDWSVDWLIGWLIDWVHNPAKFTTELTPPKIVRMKGEPIPPVSIEETFYPDLTADDVERDQRIMSFFANYEVMLKGGPTAAVKATGGTNEPVSGAKPADPDDDSEQLEDDRASVTSGDSAEPGKGRRSSRRKTRQTWQGNWIFLFSIHISYL